MRRTVAVGFLLLGFAAAFLVVRAGGSPLICKDTSGFCATGAAPFAYLLSLPVDSPITNETQLLQSIPAALWVSKLNEVDDTFWRWDGSNCCIATKIKAGLTTGCHPTSPGGCFSVAAGEGFGVVVSAPSSYNIFGNDGSTVISLDNPPGSLNGRNLISLPYCSTITTASGLMQSIGGGSIAPVTSVSRYVSATDTFQTYTGRMGSGNPFPLVPSEGYFVRMNTSVNYTTSYSATCTPSGCPSCGPDGALCDDGNACTTGDSCSGGTCVGASSVSCDDNDPRTADFCNGCTGACVNYRDPCVQPDVGGGTIAVPPVGCNYLSPADVHLLLDGLPEGTEVLLNASHQSFFNVTPLASLRGTSKTLTTETFDSDLVMHLTGTGMLAGVDCDLTLSPLHVVIESQPTQPGQAVQDFDTDMKSLTSGPSTTLMYDTCGLFESLTVLAGTDNGLPSPGHVHLERRPDGTYDVASFFNVNVTMSFVGAKGSMLEGMSGATTQVVRMGPATNLVTGTGIVVSPGTATRLVGTDHTFTANIADLVGHPRDGIAVTFSVTSGPNAGVTGTCSASPSCATDGSGNVSFTYTSDGRLGTDQGAACVTNPQGQQSCSPATVEWACTTNGAACDDGDSCTTSDVCSTGTCQGTSAADSDVGPTVRVSQSGGTSTIDWASAPGATAHDVLRGLVSLLPVGPGGGDEMCIAPDIGVLTTSDGEDPGAGESFWYLVRGQSACGTGTYGREGLHGFPGAPRNSTTCP